MPDQYYNPCGLMTMPYDNRISRQDLQDHIQAAEYTAVLSLDDQQFAASFNRPYNIFRSWAYEPTPDPKLTAKQNAEAIFKKVLPWHLEYPNTHIYINNEQSFTKLRLDTYAELIKQSVEWGNVNKRPPVAFVFGNFASGAIKCGQGSHNIVKNGVVVHTNDNSVLPTQSEIEQGYREVNEWQTKGEAFLRTMHEFRNVKAVSGGYAFILGDHQYTMFTPWFVQDGGDHVNVFNWKNRPRKVDWKKPQWHIGRTAQGIMQCIKQWNLTMPWMIITESLFDYVDDVARRDFTPAIQLPPNTTHPRGYKTYRLQWPKWFPDFDSVDEAYAEMVIHTWETVYAPLGNVLATLTYCYGNTGTWDTFDVSQPPDNEYIAIMEDYRWLPLPSEEEMPLPANAGFALKSSVALPVGVTEVNIRSGNSVFYKVKGTIPANAVVWHYNNVNENGWTYVEYNTLRGWVSLQSGNVKFTPIIDQPQTDPTLPTTGWYDADATAFAVGADIFAYKDQNSRKLAFIKTANSDDRVPVETVFNPKQSTWRAIRFNEHTGWVRSDVITFYPNEPEFKVEPTLTWQDFDFTPKTMFKIYKTPNIGPFHGEFFAPQRMKHIPTALLNPVSQTVLNNRMDGEWLAVIVGTSTIGFVRAKDFAKIEPVVATPPDPIETVAVTKSDIAKINAKLIECMQLMNTVFADVQTTRIQLETLKDWFDDATSTQDN